MIQIVVQKGTKTIKKIPLTEKMVKIGSSPDSDIQLSSNESSLIHAEFFFQDGNYFIKDLNSESRTFVNCKIIAQPTPIQKNDIINIGQYSIFLDEKSNEQNESNLSHYDKTEADYIPRTTTSTGNEISLFVKKLKKRFEQKAIYKIGFAVLFFFFIIIVLSILMPDDNDVTSKKDSEIENNNGNFYRPSEIPDAENIQNLATSDSALMIDSNNTQTSKDIKSLEQTEQKQTRVSINLPPKITFIIAQHNSLKQTEESWLKVNAIDPEGDKLTYEWKAQFGQIKGNGERVTYYAPETIEADKIDNISVFVKDTKQNKTSKSIEILLIATKFVIESEQIKEAEELLKKAMEYLKNYNQPEKAAKLFEQIIELVPDPIHELNKKARKELDQIYRNNN